ncbi:MAG: bis(5'-nucleosidyl)-tetraphosphatase [Oceanicoccus sp.]|jgi:bis(5'-nucleosidyl)-tetraphosphatase
MNTRPRRKFKKKLPIIKEKSCGIILFRMDGERREYLLLHYPGGHWDFPKGHVEDHDENEMATAHRELVEETGISDIEFLEGYREPMYYAFNRGRKERVEKVVVYFLAETIIKSIELSHEHQGSSWLPYDKAMDQLTFDNARNLLEKAHTSLNA